MTWRLAAAAAWTLLIIALCSIPGGSLPDPDVVGADKVAHFILFGVFGWLWIGVTDTRRGPGAWSVLLGGLLLAVLTEIYQGLLPFQREPSALDALANAAGLIAGISGDHLLRRKRSRRRTS